MKQKNLKNEIIYNFQKKLIKSNIHKKYTLKIIVHVDSRGAYVGCLSTVSNFHHVMFW